MNELVARIEKPELCYVFADNALRRGRNDLVLQAYRRAVDLRAETHDNVTEEERLVLKALYAYEEALSFGERRRKRATGTWQMVKKEGILPTLKKRLNSRSIDEVDEKLERMEMGDYSFRAVAKAIGLDVQDAA